MLQIALLLCGREFIARNRHLFTAAVLVWGLFGAMVLTDGMLGARYFPLTLFGWIMLCESLFTLIASSGAVGAKRGIYLFKGGITGTVALLILSGLSGSNMLLAIILGFVCFLSGAFLMVAAWVVRYPHWRRAMAGGVCQVLYAVFLFQPYPTHHDGTVPQFIGVLMLLSAADGLLLSLRMRNLAPGVTIFDVQSPGDTDYTKPVTAPALSCQTNTAVNKPELRVLVWTPAGSACRDTLPRPVMTRYIAAVDAGGVISTGHAALEMEDVYISLYPAVDIDRSPSEFFSMLRAVRENDVPGKFQYDYVSEAAAWCEADRQVCFHSFSRSSLRAFDAHYRQQEIYNLTWRNCSSSVAYALEAALDGVLYRKGGWFVFLGLLLRPELLIAAQLRRRATTMAWTPGLVLDYSRALHGLVHPVRLSWLGNSAGANSREGRKSAGE
ncbi:MFS transporter [Erwinia sp. HDF1-3R]|uniref:HdeD family acid-resistance protein n=1 Tax=Erwinia sp. HDF1-3R TaxID=3141543 RepID=UPI0031F4E0FD